MRTIGGANESQGRAESNGVGTRTIEDDLGVDARRFGWMKRIGGLSEPGAHNLLKLGAKLDQLSTNNTPGGCG